MKRVFLISVLLASASLMSCRNLTSISTTSADANSITCVDAPGTVCEEQPAAAPVVDITSPLSIFLLN